jgi:RHS repeat-associated protein
VGHVEARLAGQTTRLIAKNSETGDQETVYTYGVSPDTDSELASNDLLRSVEYPAAGEGELVLYEYNRQGQQIKMTDENATEHVYVYDDRGRLIDDQAAVGGDIDNTIVQITRSYNVRGLLELVTSYNATTGGTVVNQIENEYNDFNQLASQWQNPAGEVVKTGGDPSPRVQYAYANGGDNHVRRTSMTYPDGRVLEYDYGSGGSAADKLSRIAALNIDDGAGADPVAQYTYLGAGSVVTAHHPEPDYTWNLATGSGATRYAGLDTFDRTLACLWQDGTPDDVVKLAYEYDRVSNRINREDLVSKNLGTAVYRDEAYTYDGLDRLIDVQRGELSGGSITGLNFRQNWADPSTADTALDPTGNWADFRQDTTGNTTYDLVQTRSHNKENEITDVDATSGGSWVDPVHDAVGNTTTIPRVAAPSQNYLLTFDAWNRVVKIKTVSGSLFSIGDYSYDGLHRRVTRDRYVSNEIDFSRRMYYTDQWQVLEERQEDDSNWLPNKQYVWGIRYIDELILRDNDTSNPLNGTLNQRHYALQDANFNVVAIVGSTGSVVRRYSYDAYGYSTTLEADYSPGAYEYDFEYRYAGYRWDYETHLLQVRNRWYHPRLGRWVSRDPVGYEDGMSLYEYVNGQPIDTTDPMGTLTVTFISCHTAGGDQFFWWWHGGGDRYTVCKDEEKSGSEKLADILDNYSQCINTLNISGHGYGGAGISFEEGYKSGICSETDRSVLERIKTKLCDGATVWLHGCGTAGTPANTLQKLANRLDAKVCGCDAKCDVGPYGCPKWICNEPNDEISPPSHGTEPKGNYGKKKKQPDYNLK